MKLVYALALLATPVFATDCPAPPDHSEQIAELIADLQDVPNEMHARKITNQMWELWSDAPDEPAQEILDKGMRARSSYNFTTAIAEFDRLIEYCPDYAEGYNQRAFVNFIREDYEAALVDLDRAIERNPTHIAAIAGKALTLIGLKRDQEAQVVLRQALEMNPWLPERRFLIDPSDTEL